MTDPRIPVEEYGEQYFRRYNYADRPLGRFSMYWFARRYYAALVRRFAPHKGGRLLELGCGLGHLLGLLQTQFECVGVDLAEYCIEETRHNAPGARAMLRSADDLGCFAEDEFSVVVGLHLLEHLPDPLGAMRQVWRILEPGGLFLFATPNPTYRLRRFKDPAQDSMTKDPTHINVQPPQQWRTWLQASGFEVAKHFGDGLWDVPYFRYIPKAVQFAVLGLPALVQVLTCTAFNPLSLGVNQIIIAHKGPAPRSR